MNRLAITAALALAALAVSAPAAQAHHAWQPMPGAPNAQVAGDATDPLLAEYVAVAEAFWGAAPTCAGGIAFHFVYYADSTDAATGRAHPECSGWLNGRDWWPATPRSEGWCAAAAHEVGHGLGHGHTTDPRSVMYYPPEGGERWAWEGLVAGCARFASAAERGSAGWTGLDPAPHPALPAVCEGRSYTRRNVRAAARSVYRSPSRVTARERRALRRFRRCARRPSSRPAMRRIVRREIAWRRSYAGYWRLESRRLSSGTHAGLANLRGCESGGRYRYDGSSGYDGAYQYDARTWGEAQSWRRTPGRYRTALAWQASKDSQDVVTAAFYPSHSSRWPNCSA